MLVNQPLTKCQDKEFQVLCLTFVILTIKTAPTAIMSENLMFLNFTTLLQAIELLLSFCRGRVEVERGHWVFKNSSRS